MDIDGKVKREIEKTLKNSPVPIDQIHSKSTLKWLLILKPNADRALQIAALGHDIDRGVSGITDKSLKDMKNYEQKRIEHSIRSAKVMSDLLKKHNFDKEFIDRVYCLVERHETGGDEDSDILRDADSIAFFEYNIPTYFERNGKEKTFHKIRYMFYRVSDRAKNIIKKIKYQDKEINDLVKETLTKI